MAIVLSVGVTALAAAQPQPQAAPVPAQAQLDERATLTQVLARLTLAAALGAALAFRPQRRSTLPRVPALIQTQIIVAVVGALVIVLVGGSLAHALGIGGAAKLVRYRAEVDDPRDASLMLCCLALGMAAGVGIYWFAAFGTAFVLAVVWVLEGLEPASRKAFMLTVKVEDSADLRDGVEQVLRSNGVRYQLRGQSENDLVFEASLPLAKKTGRLTSAILALADKNAMSVRWSDEQPGKKQP